MIRFEKMDEVSPLCPHCKKELQQIGFQEMKGDLGKRCLYLCPHCHCCLGISHRKGLTMGL